MTLAWMRKQNIKPVPLNFQSKAAIFRDYAKLDYTPPGDDTWRKHNYGIGIVTGPAAGGPIDIDLDCVEAVFFAQKFLPPTPAVFGRASKRRSHYLYRSDVAEFEKRAYNDPTDVSTIVEARGDGGHQTCAPGSIHQDTGELIEWDGVVFPDIPTVPAESLGRAVRKVAIATVIARYVWQPGYRNEPVKHLTGMLFYLDWTEDEVVELIEAVMEYTDDNDRSRIPTVRATFRRGAAGKKISGAGVLRKQLHDERLVDKLLEWAGSPTVNLLQDYNDRFATVTVEGKFRIASTDTGPGECPIFYAKDDWLNKVGTDYTDVEIDGKIKHVLKGTLWLKSPRRRSYEQVDFKPGAEEDGHTLNLWGGWAIEPDKAAYEAGACDNFLDLVFNVICGDDMELATWLINWLANMVREPMRKSMTAPVIIGREGAGKSLMVAYFGAILGPAYTVVTQDKHLTGAFNRHLAGTLLLHSEEALYGGDRKHASVIRSLITDEFRMFEQKGLDAKKVKNYLRLIMLSNLPHAAPAMPGDRRYTVIDMGDRKAHDELIDKVIAEKNSTGPGALFHFLQNEWNYDAKLATKNVKNAHLTEMKSHNMTPLEAWWAETLGSGTLLPDRLAWAQQPPKDGWPATVGAPALYATMESSLRNRGVRQIPHAVSFGQLLERMLGHKLFRSSRSYSNELVGEIGVPQTWTLLSNKQVSYVSFPSLDEARAGFDRYLGTNMNWTKDDNINERDVGPEGPDY